MVDYIPELVAALDTILPTHPEPGISSGTKVPCITYRETNYTDTAVGDTLGYIEVTVTLKVWANRRETAQKYAGKVSEAMRRLGYKRTGGGELSAAGRHCTVMIYTATMAERWKGE